MDPLRASLLGGGPADDGASTSASSHTSSASSRPAAASPTHALLPWLYPSAPVATSSSSLPSKKTPTVLVAPPQALAEVRAHLSKPRHALLGEWRATAICGNDILASVLYSTGLVAAKAGKLTPVAQALVSAVLYCFRAIYEEAVTAVPLNGGSYNVLLNSTSKRAAAVAAALGIISYLATGVVSATSALHYLNSTQLVAVPIVPGAVALLLAFALLSLVGIGESAAVALAIFVAHVLTLALLAACSLYFVIAHDGGRTLVDNWHTPLPAVQIAAADPDLLNATSVFSDPGDALLNGTLVEAEDRVLHGTVATALFFGFASAMLGITGFETSAQFVEQQQPGVFRKTLRNMWALATLFNVSLSVLALAVLPLSVIYGDDAVDSTAKCNDVVLAEMARKAAGDWLARWVSLDAFVVLAGGVLTSYVGITGLVRRLAGDRVLPAFLSRTNAWRGTNHYIILLFFVAQASLVVWLDADSSALAGVFTLAFLTVMALFAAGCMLLKLKRDEIPRDVRASWASCVVGLAMVLAGLVGNLLANPSIFSYFALYFSALAGVMLLMLERVVLLRVLLHILRSICPSRSTPKSMKKKKKNGESSWLGCFRRSSSQEDRLREQQQQEQLVKKLEDEQEDGDPSYYRHTGAIGGQTIAAVLRAIHLPPIVFFCKRPELAVLNKAVLYVRKNEQTHNLRIVHVSASDDDGHHSDGHEAIDVHTKTIQRRAAGQSGEPEDPVEELHAMVAVLDRMYPKLHVEFVAVRAPGGRFNPALVTWLSSEMGVPPNMMFIRQPGCARIHRVAALGVRVITS